MESIFVVLIVGAVVYVIFGGLADADRDRIARVRAIQAQQNARWAREEAEQEAYRQRRRLEDAQYEQNFYGDNQNFEGDEDTAVAIHNWQILSNFDASYHADVLDTPENYGLFEDDSGRLWFRN